MSYSEFLMRTVGPGSDGFSVLMIGMVGIVVAFIAYLNTALNQSWYGNMAQLTGRFYVLKIMATTGLAAILAVLAICGIGK